MTKILVAASPVYGHLAPLREVAEFLAQDGHDVTLLGHDMFRDLVDTGSVRFVPFTGHAAVDPAVAFDSAERRALSGPEQFAWDMHNIFVRAVDAQHRDVRACLEQAGEEPVLLVYETGFFGAAPALLGAPGPRPMAALGLGPVSFTLSSIDTAPFGMGLPPDSSEEGRARNQQANAFVQGQVLRPAQELFEKTLVDLGVTGTPIPFFLDSTVLKADIFLQLSIEELSYRRSDTPAHVRFVGALPPPAITSGLPEWWSDVEAAGRVAVVTQGTIANQDFADLIEPTLQALADFPGLVVAATGRPGEVRDMPANARVAEFVPFDKLLPHADLLVSNGGFGAVQQALRHGIPLVVAGETEEKHENNVRLAATGAAVNLASDCPTVEQVRGAVDTVLGTASYGDNARRLAAEYARHDTFSEIKNAVDELS